MINVSWRKCDEDDHQPTVLVDDHPHHTFQYDSQVTKNPATMATNPNAFLLQLPCKILFWEIDSQEWRGSKKGTIFLVPYDNHEKTQVVFKPRGEEATTMWYVDDVASLTGGMRAKIHQALSVQRHHDDFRAVVFGKAASRLYINEDGRPIKTAWVAKFGEFWQFREPA
jgi:hypothetical protein